MPTTSTIVNYFHRKVDAIRQEAIESGEVEKIEKLRPKRYDKRAWNRMISAYRRTKYIKDLKKLALEIVDYKCERCNGDIILSLHHKVYKKVLFHEGITEIEILCKQCHYEESINKGHIKPSPKHVVVNWK